MALAKLNPPGGAGGPLYGTGWDQVILADVPLPGRCRITKGGVDLKKDKKSGAGTDGGNPTFHGVEPQEFEIEITTWTDEQRDELLSVLPPFLPLAGKPRDPVRLRHPSLRILGDVIMVKVIGASAMLPTGERGVTKMTVKLLHWLKPPGGVRRSATQTPASAVSNLRAESDAQRNPPPSTQAGTVAP